MSDVTEVKLAQPKAYVRIESKKGRGESIKLKDEQYVFDAVQIQGTPEVVSVSLGLTMNLGNFESARIDIFRSMPTDPGPENADAAFEVCKKWVADKIGNEVREVRGESVLDSKSKFINENNDGIF